MTPEGRIEQYLSRCAKLHGVPLRKVQWPGRHSAPDRVLLTRKGLIWVEVKAPGGAAKFPSNPRERRQAREHQCLRGARQRVVVIDSFADVDDLLR